MISSAVRKAGPFAGAGSTGPYTFAFKVFTSADLYVVKLDVATGVESVLTLTTHYTVSLNANQNNNPGGTITLVTALAVGYNLTISSKLADLQPVDITNQGGFYPSVQNDALDRLTILIQQADEKLDRSIKYPISDPSTGATLPAYAQRASTVLAFDSSGAPVAGPAVASVGAVLANIANINTVAGISSDVTAVAADLTNIDTAVNNLTNIDIVATDIANINTVAGISSDVTAVAADLTNIDTAVNNLTNIDIVATDIANINTVAGIDTEIAAVAANITDVTNFADVYYGPAAADPATRKDGSALQTGDLYFNTVSAAMRVYNTDTSAWAVAYTGTFGFAPATELTISGGAVTATQVLHLIDTESDADSDDLVTINGGVDGLQLEIRAAHTDRTVVIKETGNILTGGSDIRLDDTNKYILFTYDGALSKWVVVGGSGSNAVTFATAAEITTGTEPAKAIAPDQLRDSEATAAEIVTGTEKKLITADQAHTSLMKVSGSNLVIGSDADGDMYYRAASILARLAKGTAYQQLNMNSGATAPEWKASLQSLLTAAGDTIYASAANTPARLAKGTDGQVLTLSAGVPSWASGGLAGASVTQAKLKTSTGSVSTTSTTAVDLTLPGGEYGFYPQVYGSVTAHIAAFSANGTNIALNSTAGWTAYAQQRYVTSSGEVHWVFILRNKVTKETISMYQAPDHPCFGNGGKPLLVPHPFGSYDPDKHEIIVINPSDEDVFNMQDACIMPEDKPDRDILEVIVKDYEIDEDLKTEWPVKEVTVGLPKNVDWKRMPKGDAVVPVKKRIPQPDYITTRKLWKRKAKLGV